MRDIELEVFAKQDAMYTRAIEGSRNPLLHFQYRRRRSAEMLVRSEVCPSHAFQGATQDLTDKKEAVADVLDYHATELGTDKTRDLRLAIVRYAAGFGVPKSWKIDEIATRFDMRPGRVHSHLAETLRTLQALEPQLFQVVPPKQ